MCLGVLSRHMSCVTQRGQKKPLNPRELELQTAAGHHVLGVQAWSSGRAASQCTCLLIHLSSLTSCFNTAL